MLLLLVDIYGAEATVDHVKVQGRGAENRECEIWYRVPKNYDANSKALYRVLVYFGGRNFSGKTQMGYKDWHEWLDRNSIFLISPSFKNENYWDPKGWSGRALLEGIAKIKKNYRISDRGMLFYGYSAIEKTAFGNAEEEGFFTGKPYVDDLGYAFLYRNYRADMGKWQTRDPLGYPDGWNNLSYCSNKVLLHIDIYGAVPLTINAAPAGENSSGGVGSSSAGWGHAWFDLGGQSYGYYPTESQTPGGLITGETYGGEIVYNDTKNYDDTKTPYSSLTMDITPEQAKKISDFVNNYNTEENPWSLYNNCTDFLKDALDAAGIPHPDWDTLGVSDPDKMFDWILKNGGKLKE